MSAKQIGSKQFKTYQIFFNILQRLSLTSDVAEANFKKCSTRFSSDEYIDSLVNVNV